MNHSRDKRDQPQISRIQPQERARCERYHPGYYAAYVLDPDGVNVEVACQ